MKQRIYKHLEKSLDELYKKDYELIVYKDNINLLIFRLGMYLSQYISNDIDLKDYYLDLECDSKNSYPKIKITNRSNIDLFIIDITFNINKRKLNSLCKKVDNKYNLGVLVLIDKDYYELYKLS